MTTVIVEMENHDMFIDTETETVALHFKDGSFCRNLDEFESEKVLASFYAGIGYEYEEK